MIRTFCLFVVFVSVISFLSGTSKAFAQTSEYEKAQSFVKDQDVPAEPKAEEIQPVVENKLLGRVVAIEIGGKPSTNPDVITDQMTFKIGEVIHQSDIGLSYKRLYQLGLFWHVEIKHEPVAENPESPKIDQNLPKAPEGVGDIVVYVNVWQGISYYGFPYTSGGIIGDKDIFLSGKTLEAAYFQSGKDFRYWHGRYSDPQFLGSHNTASFMISQLSDLYGVRNEINYDLGERYLLRRSSFNFTLDTLYKEDYRASIGIEWQDNNTEFRNGTIFSGTNRFFYSDAEFDAANALIFKGDLSRSTTKGYPWAYDGYTWSMGANQALNALGSDRTFGKYSFKGTAYIPVNSVIDTAVVHGEYSITSGNPPHYQKPRLGYMMRGHSGLDYFGDSTLFMSGELRKTFFKDKFQGVAFVDLGKGYEKRTFTVKDLDVSAGFGVRVDASKFIRLPLLLRVDYAWGSGGDRLTFGIGQWFY